MIKWIYNLELALIKRRKDRIEKKYYKVFPDRVNDHFIATRPIPSVKVTKYHAVTLKSQVMIPEEVFKRIGDKANGFIYPELLRGIEPEIFKRLEIHTITDPEERDLVTFEGYFRFYEED